MKLKLCLLVFLGILTTGFAQNKLKISGNILDKDLKQAVPYATISVKELNIVITGAMTDDNGNFTVINLAPKTYSIDIQFIGYKTLHREADLSKGTDINLGTLYLQSEAVTLDGVNIVAEHSTIEQKIDRKVINVGRDLTTAGSTASEIMNNIPSVNVDQDGKISLRGNENVRVLVDGRPTNIEASQLLKQIPSSSIKKIELITNPSAKYNPEGMSGIINIILHKNSNDGFNGSLNSGVTMKNEPRGNTTLDLNYRTGKVNFFGNGGNNFGKSFSGGEMYRFDQQSNQLISTSNDNESYLYKLGMDYYINDHNTLSVYSNQNKVSGQTFVQTQVFYPKGIFENIDQKSDYDSDNTNSTYNLAYKHLFKKEGHTFDLEANYSEYKSSQVTDFNTLEGIKRDFYTDNIDDKNKMSTVNIDYVNPLSETATLELGAESRITRSENAYLSNNTRPETIKDSNYNYDTDIFSGYVTFGQKFKKFSYQLGARVESYQVNAKTNGEKSFKDDYITLYPSAYLTYALTDHNSFQLSYSRRVDRPGLFQTKPIREFSTPTVVSIGNPELRPQFTNSVELNYTRMLSKGTLTAGVYYRRINDEINRVVYQDVESSNENAMIMSYDNFDNNSAYGFEISANYRLTSWWDIQPALDFSSLSQKGLIAIKNETTSQLDYIQREVNANAFNARLNSNFKVTNNFRLNLFGFYRGPVDGIQMNSKEMYKIDAGARYSMLKNKLTFSLRVNDIFDTMKFAFDSQYPFPQKGQFYWESQNVYFGVNYIFGGSKNKAMQRKYREDNTKQGSAGGMF
ncbi:TonB-dependent receptor domain-containing protein [Flavobacterium sp. HSC-61S13]|uniref:TonB-dependent receptor domain-containing protein n=1 Tax=Flavobacterium sp. HSC-61S13 TaxID=2910963 RepID=UPI0020A1E595|nr:TonB-dependent receptor [Flavobacterium sp. HSC-61S13]MCP1995955.1 outer membrane receptor protein involved in Fe transport [Flavobacterium sp. HSC-61S13]